MIVARGSGFQILIIFFVLDVVVVGGQESVRDNRPKRRRCFTCRSRGEKGDCRDPFIPPEIEEENRRQSVNTAVAEIPCSTGWCSKVSGVQHSSMQEQWEYCEREVLQLIAS